jgi:hypothetical protein
MDRVMRWYWVGIMIMQRCARFGSIWRQYTPPRINIYAHRPNAMGVRVHGHRLGQVVLFHGTRCAPIGIVGVNRYVSMSSTHSLLTIKNKYTSIQYCIHLKYTHISIQHCSVHVALFNDCVGRYITATSVSKERIPSFHAIVPQ